MKQRIYIIGTGTISRHHADAARTLPEDAQLYAADLSATARTSFQQAYPHAVMFESSEAMLAHAPAAETDIVCVATPPKFHCPETLKALRSGRHVLCEKPFAMNMDEAREMVEEARRRGLQIACCSNRFVPWDLNRKMRELIATGAVGRPYLMDFIVRQSCNRTGLDFLHGNWFFLDKSLNGGGTLMDWGPYDMAVLYYIIQPSAVTISDAFSVQPDVPADLPAGVVFDIETHVGASLNFRRSGGERLLVRYERSSATHGKNHYATTLLGTSGSIEWSWLPFGDEHDLTKRRTVKPREAEEEKIKGHHQTAGNGWKDNPLHEFDRLVRGDGEALAVSGEDALNCFSILRGIYDAAASGSPVTLEFNT